MALLNYGNLLALVGEDREAERLYRRGAPTGHPRLVEALAELLERTDRSAEAAAWRRGEHADPEAADRTAGPVNARAARTVEAALAAGLGGGEPDADRPTTPAEVEALMRRKAEEGDLDAMSDLGVLCKQAGRLDEAERWYRRATANGRPVTFFNLAILLAATDRGTEALTWYGKAAEAGHVEAMTNLGHELEESDPAGAERWYRRAAEQGDEVAMANLGMLLGRAGRADEAQTWLERAAEHGSDNPFADIVGNGGRLVGITTEADLRRSGRLN
jgi:TPR repeat protein